LISPYFIVSEYCYGVEVQKALQRQEKREALVIPIVLRPVYLQDAPFMKRQALPSGGKPLTSWSSRDEAYFRYCQ
jgi:hypothetical protein